MIALPFLHSLKKGSNKLIFLTIILSFLSSACSTHSDPDKTGFFGSMYHLSKGTYKYRNVKKQQELRTLKHQQRMEEKEIHVLKEKIQKKQQELLVVKKSLLQITTRQQEKEYQLNNTKQRHASSKSKHHQLQQKVNELDQSIKKEKAREKEQAATINSLQKKRDALRKELILQSSDPL